MPHPAFSADSLATIAHHAQALVNAETTVIALLEEEGEVIFYAAAVGKHAAAIQGKRGSRTTSGLCSVALNSGQAELVCHAKGDVRVRQDIAEALGINTALAAPIVHEGTMIGAIMVLNRCDGMPFDEEAQSQLFSYAQTVTTLL